jgi:hypothetical protein
MSDHFELFSESRWSRAPGAGRFEMTSEPQEIGSRKNPAARLPEIDFAVVLSRAIESIEHDPAQLRNSVYEIARIKLEKEICQTHPAINSLEASRLTLALESAIEGVETIYSKHDELRALRSLHRLIESSEIRRSEMMTKPREPLLMVGQPAAQTAYGTRRITENRIAASSPDRGRAACGVTSAASFGARQSVRKSPAPRVPVIARRGASLKLERLLHWRHAAPLLRGAMVVIFAVALCAVLSQFGQLRQQAAAPQPAGQLRQQAALSSLSQPESAPMGPPSIAQIQDVAANFSDRRFADAVAQGVGFAPSHIGPHDVRVVPDEQPVKPPGGRSCTQTYKVPSESGGQVSINVVRC